MNDVKWLLLRIGLDFASVIPILAVASGIFLMKPFQGGYFPDDESLSYPYRSSTVTSAVLYSVSFVVPVATILTAEFIQAFLIGIGKKYKSFYLVGLSIYKFLFNFGFGYAVNCLFVQIGKKIIGRLRPHFFAVCVPSATKTSAYNYVTEYTCGGSDADALDQVRLSFPSGHAAYSMYAAIFICIYIYYRFPRIPAGIVIRTFLQTLFFSLAFYTGLSRVSDYKHHWSDVLVGMIQGTLVAICIALYATDLNEFSETTQSSDDLESSPLRSKRMDERSA